jgi:hypothetical protein
MLPYHMSGSCRSGAEEWRGQEVRGGENMLSYHMPGSCRGVAGTRGE